MLLWLVAIAVFVLDSFSKSLIVASLGPGETWPVVQHVLWWTYAQNRHGAFGLFGDSPIVLISLSLGVLLGFAFALRDGLRRSPSVRVAFGLIAGGAIGNVIDRIHHRYVVDFIDFKTIWPNIFNVADCAITVGVGLLFIVSLAAEISRRNDARAIDSK